jgi:transcriptional regulator with XRE-family HTH domain
LTQSALARQLACQQSAISMLEGGRSEALSQETIARLAALLDVTLEATALPGAAADRSAGRTYCPQAECPSNVPFAINGEVVFWPRPQPGAHQPGRHCAFCGEVLAAGCPACGAPVSEGCCCRACGAVLVPPPATVDAASAETWASARRRQIADWRALLA